MFSQFSSFLQRCALSCKHQSENDQFNEWRKHFCWTKGPQSGHSAGWWLSGERIWEITHSYEKLNIFLIIYHFWIMECWCHSYCGSCCKRPPIRSSFGLFFSPLISPLSLGRLYIPSLHEFTNDIKVICGLFASHFICKCMLIYVNKSRKWLILGNFNRDCHLSSLKESFAREKILLKS